MASETTSRKQVAVLFGGRSGEHEVSQASAKSVFDNLDRDAFSVHLIGITKDGRWVLPRDAQVALREGLGAVECDRVVLPPSHGASFMVQADGRLQHLVKPDVVFPVLHGPHGEDGTVQGLLELTGLPYVGAGVLGSAMGMDKVIMKRLFLQAGLRTARFIQFTRHAWDADANRCQGRIIDEIGVPCFVKPANLGSSVGITKVKAESELAAAVELAMQYDLTVIVEESIDDAHEIECSILGNEKPRASVLGEILPSREFYSYEAKYIDASELRIPAPLPEDVSDRVRQTAIEAFRTLQCSGLARVDFLVKRNTYETCISEINTMPGFTEISMYPKLWAATDLPYNELLSELISLGIARHTHRSSLKTSYD